MADINGDGKADIIAFGTTGVETLLSTGYSFTPPMIGLDTFQCEADKYPCFVVDVNGDGRADIVSFGETEVKASLSNGDGTFGSLQSAQPDFSYDSGWRIERHPCIMADVNADGRNDIVGFGYGKVMVALANDDGTFGDTLRSLDNFTYNDDWTVDNDIRIMSDINGDGRADIIAIGDAGVYTALASESDGYFDQPKFVLSKFGKDAGGWSIDKHPRMMADVNGDGWDDIVGFGYAGVVVSLSDGDGTFSRTQLAIDHFGYSGGWRVGVHTRMAVDVNNDGKADIVGFSNTGVDIAYGQSDGTFLFAGEVLDNFGYNDRYDTETHLRFLLDVTGNGKLDIVVFEKDGVYTSLGE